MTVFAIVAVDNAAYRLCPQSGSLTPGYANLAGHSPAGLFVDGVGTVVANDVYATAEVWDSFTRDFYHSPRVVRGREINLLTLGLAR